MTEDVPAPCTIATQYGSFVVRDSSNSIDVAMNGEFDISGQEGAQRLLEHVGELVGARPRPVVIDLAAVEFLDASGLRLLVRIERVARLASTTTSVRNPKPHVRRLLAIVELDGLIDDRPVDA